MSQIIVTTADEISLDDYAAMQRESFKDLLIEMGVSDSFMTPAFYKWKYNTPFGKAKLILAIRDDEMVASTMILPMELLYGDRRLIGWQNGDTATVPSAQKIGLYPRCMKKAVSLVEKDQILFGFPNKNSIRGFSFYVKYDKGVVPLLVRLRVFPTFGDSSDISAVEKFGGLQIDFEKLQSATFPLFHKNSAYLDWRYRAHPLNQYASYISRNSQNEICGLIVTRNAVIQNKNVLLIMELMGTDLKTETNLLRYAISKEAKGRFVLSFNSMYSSFDALKRGFVVVPVTFIPKRQVLFASAGGGDFAKEVLVQPWRLQMGDWDGF